MSNIKKYTSEEEKKKKILESIKKYDKANTKGIYLKLNKKNDKDILDKLETVDNRQGYIKRAIRDLIDKEG